MKIIFVNTKGQQVASLVYNGAETYRKGSIVVLDNEYYIVTLIKELYEHYITMVVEAAIINNR